MGKKDQKTINKVFGVIKLAKTKENVKVFEKVNFNKETGEYKSFSISQDSEKPYLYYLGMTTGVKDKEKTREFIGMTVNIGDLFHIAESIKRHFHLGS